MKYYLTIVTLTLVGLYFHNVPKNGVANTTSTKLQPVEHPSHPLRDLPNGCLEWERLYGDMPRAQRLLLSTGKKTKIK
jgi:hypothetical protein